MIKTDFFPTVTTNPSTGAELTDLTSRVATSETFPAAYYLGWIALENVPQALTPGRLTTTTGAGGSAVLHFTNDLPKNKNFACGYFGHYVSRGEFLSPMSQLQYSDGAWKNLQSGEEWAFFNKCDAQKCGEIHFKYYIYYGIGAENADFSDVTSWHEGTIENYYGAEARELTKNFLGLTDALSRCYDNGKYFKLGRQSFTREDGGFEVDAENGDHLIGYIIGFRIHDNRNARDVDNPSFFVSMPTHDPPCVTSGSYTYDTSYSKVLIRSTLLSGGYDGSDLGWLGIKNDFDVTSDQINAMSQVGDRFYVPNCAIFVLTNTTYGRIAFYKIFALDDIVKLMSLQIRIAFLGRDGYAAQSVLAPYITEDEEFTATYITGDLSDTTFKDKLRPWQYDASEWAENDFTEDDVPQRESEDDDEKIGDSIGFNLNIPGGTATGLYTMYALRQAHISNLGAALWTSFNTPDSNFWQNVRMAAGLYEEAGSFDLTTILDYIASIRIYPFALINLPGYTGAGTGAIRMGTGKIPLDLSSNGAGNVGIMGSYTGIIDAGSVTIPAHYGDFRDLEGVTMSVYLPYIGNVTLNPAEVTGQTLQATYAVDLTSGACVAYLLLSGSWGYYPIGVYSGTIGADIPLTASQGNRMFLRDMKNVLGLGSILGGSLSGVDATDGDALAGAIGSGLASGAAYMAKNVYQQGMGGALTPPTLGGGGANFAGFGAPQTAYMQIRRHLYAYNMQTFPASHMGRRSYGVHTLGTLSGFTVCDAVDVSGIPAPSDIQTDIKNALESGVYL